jgi:predicted DNA-binding protein
MKQPKRQYTIYLDERQQRVVETLSTQTRRSISGMISEIIYDFIDLMESEGVKIDDPTTPKI